MQIQIELSDDAETVHIFIPMQFKRSGGRKQIILPAGTNAASLDRDAAQDSTLLKALVRAHRWQRMLDTGAVKTQTELARKEGISGKGYTSKLLRLTLLAPDIQEAILNATHPRALTLARLMSGVPLLWAEQRVVFGLV